MSSTSGSKSGIGLNSEMAATWADETPPFVPESMDAFEIYDFWLRLDVILPSRLVNLRDSLEPPYLFPLATSTDSSLCWSEDCCRILALRASMRAATEPCPGAKVFGAIV